MGPPAPAPLVGIRGHTHDRPELGRPIDDVDLALVRPARPLVSLDASGLTRCERCRDPLYPPQPPQSAPPRAVVIPAPRALTEVRRRPGMYVGGTGTEGQLHLVYEVLANAIDLHLVGRCQVIEVTVRKDGAVSIRDDGPGLPVIDDEGRPLLLLALTELHDAPTKDGHPVHIHLAARGLGLSVVNALSDRIEVTTAWQGRRWGVSGGAGRLAAHYANRQTGHG